MGGLKGGGQDYESAAVPRQSVLSSMEGAWNGKIDKGERSKFAGRCDPPQKTGQQCPKEGQGRPVGLELTL